MLSKLLLQSALLALTLLPNTDLVSGKKTFGEKVRGRQQRAERLYQSKHLEDLQYSNSSYRFLSNATNPYLISSLPEVNYDLGEMYSGLVPISTSNSSRALFFVFQPTIGEPVDEITIWLNGGPGCSSLEGFLQENGRFLWQPGVYSPQINYYSWVNLTNMLWVEQPVGTGFSPGEITAKSQEDIAADFIGFFKNFQTLFGIKNFKIYVTGESYAGRYVPYISAAMLDQNNTEYYNLSGALVYDPCIGQFDYTQQEVPVIPFVQQNNNLFNFNASFMAELERLNEYCGYANYTAQFLQFPPIASQPPILYNASADPTCDVFDMINTAAFDPNPCFDIYEINQMCPILWNVVSFPTELVYAYPGAQTYFNRTDVKMAMHAPLDTEWNECANHRVFIGGNGGPQLEGDLSADPIQHVLPQVIEATNRVLVSNADYDMIIITNGTLMAIQNMTWNGKLGFQSQPATPIDIMLPDLQDAGVFAANGAEGLDGPQGVMGIQHYERGLMWAETYQAGHMQPEFQPRVTYRHLQWLLGRIDTL